MDHVIYLALTVLGFCATWFVWDLGLKKVMLDTFRERLFQLRFRLFVLAERGEVEFDSEVYRSIELLLCGLLRYGHRMTFMGFIFSIREQERARRANEYVDYQRQIRLRVSKTSPEVRQKLDKILSDVNKAVMLYTSASSLLFLLLIPIVMILRSLNMMKDFTKSTVSAVFEDDVYRTESRRTSFSEKATA